MKSVLLRLATLVAIVLSTVAVAVPANAATVNSSQVAISVPNTVTPFSYGALQCSGDLCIQRVTSVENNSAYVELWARNSSFYGHFELIGPDGPWMNSKDKTWPVGCCGWLPDVPKNHWTAKEWALSGGAWHNIGQVSFSV